MTRSSKAGSAVAAAFFAAALVLATAPAAWAHAAYKDSTPGDGETVLSPPSQVTAEFTEPITNSSYLEVYDPCGQRVDNGDSQISGYDMSITMSADKAGEYVVEFAAQSIDTHVTYGSFSFSSSGGSSCSGADPEQPGTGGSGGGGSGGGGGGGTAPGGSGPGSMPGGGGRRPRGAAAGAAPTRSTARAPARRSPGRTAGTASERPAPATRPSGSRTPGAGLPSPRRPRWTSRSAPY
ncbi:MAG: copper resistance protein CopC [Actinomycetota bacterium]|nr:copper resistance protein CopC [Actinomycetota bacterium]